MGPAGPITFRSMQTPKARLHAAQKLPIRVLGKTLTRKKNRQRLSWNRQIYPAIHFTVKPGLASVRACDLTSRSFRLGISRMQLHV